MVSKLRVWRWIGCLALLITALLSFVAWYFSTTPLYVVKTFLRAVALSGIQITVALTESDSSRETGSFTSSAHLKGTGENQKSLLLQHCKAIFGANNVALTEYKNDTIVLSRYPFGYQTSTDSRLYTLKKKYNLESIASKTDNDFLQIVAIANWVQSQWLHGISGADKFQPVAFNADKILESARSGYRFWCHVSAMTLIQTCSSLGHQARLVSLSRDGYNIDHAVAECWSNYYRKWVVIDPDFNLWYERDGVPLNVLEVHDAVLTGEAGRIIVRRGIHRPLPELEERISTLFGFYRYFYVDMRNDWLSNQYFYGHPKRSDKATLFWRDSRLPPVLNLKPKVSNKNDLYWDLNKTQMRFVNPNQQTLSLDVDLDTVTLDFSHFEVSIDGAAPIRVSNETISWPLHVGQNSIAVRSVTTLGKPGIVSSVSLSIE